MNNDQAKLFTNNIFNQLFEAKTISEVENIENHVDLFKFKMKKEDYPKIHFAIDPAKIAELKAAEIILEDGSLHELISEKITDPLTMLLYSLSWKNGDLKKVKHIVKGILDHETEDEKKDDGLTFYQFGKYLTKSKGQPIIDQHVIRAFCIHKFPDDVEIWRKTSVLNKSHKDKIIKYKNWLSTELQPELMNESEYGYHIDKVLFATGRAIKL